MNTPQVDGGWRRAAPFAMFVLIVAALYFGSELLQPFAIAGLLTFLLAPGVNLLMRLRLPRVLAVAITVTVALSAVIALGYIVVSQLDELRGSLTEYHATISEKLSALGVAVTSIGEGLNETMQQAPMGVLEPLAVRVVSSASPFTLLGDIAGPLIDPLGTLAIVFVLVLFMLIYLDDVRDRIAYILNVRDVTVTIQAATEVSSRISRYLLMTLLINATYGVPVAIGLLLLGVPNAILWGVLAVFLRFIPYVGPWLAAAMPIALSFAISPGWGLTAAVIGLFLVLELVSNNIIEPWIYGSRTGLSPLAIIVAAIFWAWLWGIAGLLLSIPLTLILVVSGRYVRPLRFMYTLFGDGPGLAPPERFYQRLVANDANEAARIAEAVLTRRPLLELYDALMIPALRSLKFDEAAGWIGPVDAAVMRQSLSELLADLPAYADKKTKRRLRHAREDQATLDTRADGFERLDSAVMAHAVAIGVSEAQSAVAVGSVAAAEGATASTAAGRVTFIPTGDDSGVLVGAMLADVMRAEGVIVETAPTSPIANELVDAGAAAGAELIVVGGFLPGNLVRLRHIVARLAERLGPATPIVVGLWNAPISVSNESEEEAAQDKRKKRTTPTLGAILVQPISEPDPAEVEDIFSVGAHQVVHTLAAAADAVRGLLRLERAD